MSTKPKAKRSTKNQRGMTLVEIMVVLVIIGMVMAFVGVNVWKYLHEAKIKATKAQIAKFNETLATYRLSKGSYPSTSQGLSILTNNDNGEPYMENVPLDPWHNGYVYVFPGQHNQRAYDLCSHGKDGIGGTEDDICNYALQAK